MIDENRLKLMLDQWEILQLLNSYPRALDRHDVGLIHAFFAPDAVDHHGDFRGDREAFANWVNELHEKGSVAHTHLQGSPTIKVKGDEARSELYVMATLKSKVGDTADVLGGRYLDRLERRNGEWAVVDRDFVLDWTLEVPSADRRKALERYPTGRWDTDDLSYAHFAGFADAEAGETHV